jgi:hypothetical protein
MKRMFKWYAIAGLLILAVVCIDLNLSNYKYASVDEEILDIVNSATLSILLIVAIRFVNKTSKTRMKGR